MVQLGNILINGNLALSPMAGISDSPYRNICRKFGAAFSFTEFVSTEQILLGNPKSIAMFRFEERERPIFFQIFGSKLDTVVSAAKIASEFLPDVIDLNMGCSVSKVAQHGSGAGLLKNPILAGQMIEGIRKVTNLPTTAKIRLGWDENNLNYKEVIHILQESGVSAISVHGRTKSMGYSGMADWDRIAEIKSIAKVPIFGNGDIQSFTDAKLKQKQSKVDLVLIGRKAIGNPWIFKGVSKNEVSLEEIVSMIREHARSMLSFYPSNDNYALVLFRKHLVRYLDHLTLNKIWKDQILNCLNLVEFENLLEGLQNQIVNPELSSVSTDEVLSCESYVK